MNITKNAPLPERLSEQLTCCEKIGLVQGNYINCVDKRHNYRITGKTKATAEGRQWVLRQIKLERIVKHATFAAGGQCAQCASLLVGCSSGSVRCHAWNERIFLEYSLRYFSRANAHGANLSGSCSFSAFLRCFFLDEANCSNVLSVIVDTCNPVRRSSAHHGAGGGYSDSLSLWCFSSVRANQSLYIRRGIFFSSFLHIRSLLTCSLLMQFPRRKINKNKEPSQYSVCCTGYSSFAFSTLRCWRYSTSRFNAAVTNCPVLSPGIFTASTLFITSCGTLAATVCDFAFTAFVAMLCTSHKKQMQYAGKK